MPPRMEDRWQEWKYLEALKKQEAVRPETVAERKRPGASSRHFESHAGTSEFRREILDDGRWMLFSKEGEKFYLDTIKDPEDQRIEQVQGLLLKTFNPEEVCPIEEQRDAVAENQDPARTGEHLLQVISDEHGKVTGFIEARYQPATGIEGTTLKDGVVMVGYVITDPAMRGKGIGKELYAKLFEDADRVAKARGEKVRFVAGEAVQSVEPVLNKFGRGRMYTEQPNGTLREFKYFQPPLSWDLRTGEKAADADTAPEHFMIGETTGERNLRPDEALACVRSFYDYLFFEVYKESDFETPGAYAKARATVEHQLKEFEHQLAGAASVTLIPGNERRMLKKTGKKFDEHVDADKVKWDEMAEG